MLSNRAKKNVNEVIAELNEAGKELDPKYIAGELSLTVGNVKEYLNELYPSAGRLPVIPTFNCSTITAVSKTAKDSGSDTPDTFVIRFNLDSMVENIPAKKNANKKTGESAKIGYNKNTQYIKIATTAEGNAGVNIDGKVYFLQPTMLVFTTNKEGILPEDFVVTEEAAPEVEVEEVAE